MLKQQTQKKRSSVIQSYDVYWDMPLNMSVSELFSASSSKRKASKLLGEALLKHYESKNTNLVVAYENKVVSSAFATQEHSHDEADQLIPNQVIDCARTNPYAQITVESPATDVFMILMHLTAKGHLSVNNTLTLITGQGKKKTHIDIIECVCAVGPNKSKGLLGFHNCCGSDWGEMDRNS